MSEKQTEADQVEMPEEVADLHGVAVFLVAHLEESEEEGEAFKPLAKEVLDEVDAYLKELAEKDDGTEELMHAVQTLGGFVVGNRPDSPKMVEQVKALLDRPHVVEAVKKWSVSADPEQVKAIADRFGDFAGVKADKTAPKVGDEKPEGAIDLNALNFPKRL